MRPDAAVKDDILAEIEWDPQIDSADIGVTVEKGSVTLFGTVNSYAERLAAGTRCEAGQGRTRDRRGNRREVSLRSQNLR